MKTFYVSLVLFAVLLGAILCNVLFISHMANEIEDRINKLPACNEAGIALEELIDYWEKKKVIASLSVSYEVLYEMEKNLTDMKSSVEQAEDSDFEAARALSLASIRQVRRLEKISVENIF